jgi:RNA polymerase sigma-70 factor (ECF subfamily)
MSGQDWERIGHGVRCLDPDSPRREPWVNVTARTDPGAKRATDPLLEIYLERRANLVRFYTARTGSPALAEDLAQELYVKLAGRDLSITAENPVALIYRIATNVMLDRARGESRSLARDGAWRTIAHASLGDEDVSDDAPADRAVAARQRLSQLVDAVAALPPQMQRAFRLHKLEGHSHAETARIMGISVKAVEKHVSAALKTLTSRLSS